jgi:hypothetical protein
VPYPHHRNEGPARLRAIVPRIRAFVRGAVIPS